MVLAKREPIYWDLECWPNFFLFGYITDAPNCPGWKAYLAPHKPTFTAEELAHMQALITSATWYGFNSLNYDAPMWRYAMAGANNAQLKALNDEIIVRRMKRWEVERNGWPQATLPGWDQVDIMEVLPGVKIGLKTYMARNHSETLQDLPYPPDTVLTLDQMRNAWNYHGNDLKGTRELKHVAQKRLDFREKLTNILNDDLDTRRTAAMYGTAPMPYIRNVDLRSKSDAQMSEAILSAKLGYRPDVPYVPSGTRFRMQPAPWLQFASQYMQDVHRLACSVEFEWNRKDPGELLPDGTKTGVTMPAELKKLRVTIGDTVYKFGIGGLHSQEKSRTLRGPGLRDSDVAGYYPELVRALGVLVPEQQAIYVGSMAERRAAKDLMQRQKAAKQDYSSAETDSDTGKIIVNGWYGKLWSKYSPMCNPQAGVSVTINGQLTLLMLIERLHLGGVAVVSANTDGIVTQCPPGMEWYRDGVMRWWEGLTGFTLEHKDYALLAQRDVNSYAALTIDGEIKRKGVFAESGVLSGMQGIHPDRDISKDAAVLYMTKGVPVSTTIRACTDIRKFVLSRKVKGGAYHNGQYLGPTARWYYGTSSTEPLRYDNGNKVAASDNAGAIQRLPGTLPADINYAMYEAYALELIQGCGFF